MAASISANAEAMTILPEVIPPPAGVEESADANQQTTPLVGEDLSEQTYVTICQILKQGQDFDLEGYKDLCIKRRIAARIRAVGLADPEPYILLLQDSVPEQVQLLEALTIHVSQFFRNPSTFTLLEKRILPELLQQARQSNSKLRIWSAGCAGGEEAYSIALLCQDLLQADDLLSIVATDISSDIIRQAKKGVFAKSRLAEVSAALLERYFVASNNSYQLSEEILNRVRFLRHDILSEQTRFRVDLLLCRNLLIYFSRSQQERILRFLAASLLPGGYLVLGRAETLVPAVRELFKCVDPAERIYQRL